MKEEEKQLYEFVDGLIREGAWTEYDRNYLQNRVMALIGMEELTIEEKRISQKEVSLLTTRDQLVAYAVRQQVIEDSFSARDQLGAVLMDFLTPSPTEVNRQFQAYYQESPKKATDYFYHLSCQNDYIKTRAIAKNSRFFTKRTYGTYEITINLAKPEKDPKDIARARTMKAAHYPRTMLAPENEGYLGRADYPARVNHRIIWFPLAAETWGFQYSPYAYYQEHCIFLNQQVVPMKIEKQTFERLLTIVDAFPHYFVGSNADLPIVGGSILSHDHYQGGLDVFPMSRAEVAVEQAVVGYPSVHIGIVNWPMSVIRMKGPDKNALVQCATSLLHFWQQYTDASQDLLAVSPDGTPHHTITPIARQRNGVYELDLVLRDNHTTPAYPDGLFHPHPAYHHIKKENIGLIEVMGLAILPPRLKAELVEVNRALLGKESQVAPYHQDWVAAMKQHYGEGLSEEQVNQIVEESIGTIFEHIFENAGVFKRTPEGQQAFQTFIDYWQMTKKGEETDEN